MAGHGRSWQRYRLLIGIKPELMENIIDDHIYGSVNRDGHGLFAFVRRFERPELAVQQPRRHENDLLRAASRLAINCCVPFEIDDADVVSSTHEDIAIGPA